MGTNNFYRLPPRSDAKNDFSDLKLESGQIPKPKPNEVLIRIHAVSLNYRDLTIAKGLYPLNLSSEAFIPASDGAGEVVDTGEDVKKWKKGDRVAGIFHQKHLKGGSPDDEEVQTGLGGAIDGMLAQYRALPDYGLVRIPSHLSYEQAATLPCAALTAFNGMYGLERLLPGQTVLAEGTGGVSVFTLQFASAAGARTIITSSSDEKLAKIAALGKNVHTINYKKTPNWEEEVLKITNGHGVDNVIEVGGAGTLEKALKSVKRGGIVSAIGFVAKAQPPDVPLYTIQKNCVFRGIYVGSREQFEDMNRVIELHKIVPVIDKVFPFTEAQKAYEYQWSQTHIGKVVIKVD